MELLTNLEAVFSSQLYQEIHMIRDMIICTLSFYVPFHFNSKFRVKNSVISTNHVAMR